MTSRRRSYVFLFIAAYLWLIVLLQPVMSIGKVILVIPAGLFLTLALNEWLKNKP